MEDDKELEAFFASARMHAPAPDEALLARVAAQGRSLQPMPRTPRLRDQGRPAGPLRGLLAAIGGWPALGGLMTAGLAGLWLGLSDAGGLMGYVYGSSTDGWLYGPADLVSMAVAEDGE
ncbi:hypothetical protein OEW28_09150 [Defluviimonas sp. WL0002]|uniref:Dihydroorotate dehydrogenase n=1 Tax=Albidovulum marisflavi TaxID=2984159 RepID=A0ABT2ZCC0_9RHOB|nr:hypothetical protein [Defluviimonas sp. WL0002]MCV2868793.1 hypothetical protein [Defluviimonas sp. WL0002]